jgi:hypothetical protein
MYNSSEVHMNIGFIILWSLKSYLERVLYFLRIIMQILLNTMIQIVMQNDKNDIQQLIIHFC